MPEGMEPTKDNIPGGVEAILDCLTEAHNIVSRIRPETEVAPEENAAPEAQGLERRVIRALEKAGHLNRRLGEIADSVGRL